MPALRPFLWFDGRAEEAAEFYVSLFPDASMGRVTRYIEGTPGEPGTVMMVEFAMLGQEFVAFNGGPAFTFNEAISMTLRCEDQAEVDHYWERLGEGGKPMECGWIKDRFGLVWQVTPAAAYAMVTSDDEDARRRYFEAMMTMTKLDLATLEGAFRGE